jgi:hypothetical protein
MEEYCFDVEKAIDYAFSEQKFIMNFYQYLKGKEAKRAEAKQFLESSTAINLKLLVEDLDTYLEGGQDEVHKQLREAYGYLSKPFARKIRNYLDSILTDTEKYLYDKRPGRRKKITNK